MGEKHPASGKSDYTRSGVQGIAVKTLDPSQHHLSQQAGRRLHTSQWPQPLCPTRRRLLGLQELHQQLFHGVQKVQQGSKGTTRLCTVHTCLPVTGRPGAGVWRPKMSPDLLLGIVFSRRSSTLTPASQADGRCTLAAAPPDATQTPKSICPDQNHTPTLP